jgi:ribonuclease G
MTAELLVNVTPSETRVAYIDGGILQEIHIERESKRGIVAIFTKGVSAVYFPVCRPHLSILD